MPFTPSPPPRPPPPPRSATFDDAIKEFNPLLVEFYAPWCGHCKKLTPEYASAAAALLPKGLRIAKVDATVEKATAARFSIEGFPTLKFFRGSAEAASEYGGGRTSAEIVAWVTKKSAPATSPVASEAELQALAKEAGGVAYLALTASADSALHTAYAAVAAANEGAFGLAIGAAGDALRAAYGVAADAEAVVAVNDFEGQDNVVVKGADEALEAFVAGNALPLVVPFSPATAQKIFAGSIKTHYLLFAKPAAEGTGALLAAFRTLSKANTGALLFVSVDPLAEGNDKILSFFGVKEGDVPAAAIIKMAEEGPKKHILSGATTPESIAQFLADYQSGALKPTLKSAPAPAADPTSAVRVLVGTTFESEVLNGPEDLALVEFYAPWCGHCKALAPTWEKLADKVKGNSKVAIFKMDYTENEVDHAGVSIKGFPTVRARARVQAQGRRRRRGRPGLHSPPSPSPRPPLVLLAPRAPRPPRADHCLCQARCGRRQGGQGVRRQEGAGRLCRVSGQERH